VLKTYLVVEQGFLRDEHKMKFRTES